MTDRYFGNLTGEEGLLIAVIARAVKDAQSAGPEWRADALRYFAGREYEEALLWLGMPLMLPAEFTQGEKHHAI